MIRKLNEEALINVIWGATLLARWRRLFAEWLGYAGIL